MTNYLETLATATAATPYDDSLALGATIAILITSLLMVGLYVISQYVIIWQLFTKAGRPGWACLIPFYSGYVFGTIAKNKSVAIAYVITQTIVGIIAALSERGVLPSLVDYAATLAALIFTLVCLIWFIKQYDAGIGKWLLFLIFPIVGVFFVKTVRYKKALVEAPQTTSTTGQPLPPAFVPAYAQARVDVPTEATVDAETSTEIPTLTPPDTTPSATSTVAVDNGAVEPTTPEDKPSLP